MFDHRWGMGKVLEVSTHLLGERFFYPPFDSIEFFTFLHPAKMISTPILHFGWIQESGYMNIQE